MSDARPAPVADPGDRRWRFLPSTLRGALASGRYGADGIEAHGSPPGRRPLGIAVTRYPEGTDRAALLLLHIEATPPLDAAGWLDEAAALLDAALSGARTRGAKAYTFEYDDDFPARDRMEALFARLGFAGPSPCGRVCRCTTRKILDAPWVKSCDLPEGFEAFLWKELPEADRRWLLASGLGELNVPPLLSPFRDPHLFEPLNSMGVRAGGRVAGWQINHRIGPATIRYTATFIREDLQAYGLILPLMGQSIRRQFSGGLWCNRAVFMVPNAMTNMSRFVDRRFKKYVDEIHETFHVEKNLC